MESQWILVVISWMVRVMSDVPVGMHRRIWRSRDAPKNGVVVPVRMVRVRPRRYTREAPHNGGVRENGGERGPGY